LRDDCFSLRVHDTMPKLSTVSTLLFIVAVSTLPSIALAQRETQYERQTREERQAAHDLHDQSAAIEAIHAEARQKADAARAEAELRSRTRGEKSVPALRPDKILHQWTFSDWQIWAEPDKQCRAIEQDPNITPIKFWGFRQKPGGRVELFFSGNGNERPITVEMSFNGGGRFKYPDNVERWSQWNVHVVSLQSDALSIFPNITVFESFANGSKILWEETHVMRKVESSIEECLNWQQRQ
jgi:hypothetical protein